MLNQISIMGRLTRDPELRRTSSGKAVTSFTLAVDRDFANDWNRETDFIECVAWGNTGEFVAKYFSKGSMAVVSGRLQIRTWKDKEGNNRKTAEVVVSSVYFGEKKSETTTTTKQEVNLQYPNLPVTNFCDQDFNSISTLEDNQLPF